MQSAWVVDGVRTPFGRYGGSLSTMRADDLAAVPLRALMARNPKLDWSEVEDVIYGCANQAGEDNRNVARMAALLAGVPVTVPGTTINRLCGSSLDAVGTAARAILAGQAHIMVAGGVESMSRAPFVIPKADSKFSRAMRIEDTTIGWRFVNSKLASEFGVDSMPETAENVASEFGISRKDQDAFAVRSQQRAARAAAAGVLSEQIVPVQAPPSTPRGAVAVVGADEHPRPETTMASLAQLSGVVSPKGTVTAGNSSGINDGACALLLASDDAVERLGFQPQCRIVGMAASGVAPRIMGVGPVQAVQRLLGQLDWSLRKVDVIELNEAFAAQSLAVLRQLGLADDAEHVNPHGGAIALGHPLGASGARLVLAAVRELERTGGRRAIATMCVGVGQGIAVAIERVPQR